MLGPRLAVIIDAGGRDIGMAEPLLDLGDIGLVVECVGSGGCSQRMGADLETQSRRIPSHELVGSEGASVRNRTVRNVNIGPIKGRFAPAAAILPRQTPFIACNHGVQMRLAGMPRRRAAYCTQ
jgi:hypothetical protein